METHAIIIPHNDTARRYRASLQAITFDPIEALILDLLDEWTSKDRHFDQHNPESQVWLSFSADDVLKGLKMQSSSTSASTIRRKLNSLIEKDLLMAKQDKSSRNPKDRLFCLNLPRINTKILEYSQTQASN